MSETLSSDPAKLARVNKPGALDRLFRRAVCTRLAGLRHGLIRLTDGEIELSFGERSSRCDLEANLRIHAPATYRRMALHGSIGAGEGYMAGEWSCDNLTDLVRILVLNLEVVDRMERGLALLYRPILWALHVARRNTHQGSRSNIAAHYDLGNDFYRLFLDETLMYSCGVFAEENTSLHQASVAKNDRICRKLQLDPHDHVLEIGTGWGGFALHAAAHYGCKITTTTISREQYELTRQRVNEAGLGDRVTVLFEDYRDLRGQYDKLVSIEMIEAVGHQYYATFFRQCARMLKPEGMMLLQTITIADQRYEQAKRAVDFIQRYIFPGGCLPSVTALCCAMTEASDLRPFQLEDIGPHYATTIRHWRERFLANLHKVRDLGYTDEFIRMWEFYLGYCEGAFMERAIANVQMLLVRPWCRREALVPAL